MTDERKERENQLLIRIREGDEKAFSELYHTYKNKLYSFLLGLVQIDHVAEDLFQEIFYKVWTNRESISEVDNFNAFIYRMARNQAIDELRRFSKETLMLTNMRKRENEYQLDPFKLFENNEIAQKINEAIEQLPPQQKKIYILHNRKGHSLEKIAQELDLSIFTIRNHLAKANNKLRKILSSSYPELFAYSLFVISQFTFF
jgi:RNA polymerase sigma-70 factor (ECF subfamily)